jgi:hypothetical protein
VIDWVRLTDPEGNGVYTGSGQWTGGDTSVRFVQGTSTYVVEPGPLFPDRQPYEIASEPAFIIEDLGTINITEDRVFEAIFAADQQPALLTKTFELTLYDDAPPGVTFRASYERNDTITFRDIWFCGYQGGPPCVGSAEGIVYWQSVPVLAGVLIRVVWIRDDDPTALGNEPFFHTEETLTSDQVNTASYTFEAVAPTPVPTPPPTPTPAPEPEIPV